MAFSVAISDIGQVRSLPLERAQRALQERSEWLETVLREAGPELDARSVRSVPVPLEDGQELAELVRRVSDELTALSDRVDELLRQEQVLSRAQELARRVLPGNDQQSQRATGTFGELVAKAIRNLGMRGETVLDVEAADVARLILGKATMTTTAGLPPETSRTGRVAWYPTEPIQVADILPTVGTAQAAVVYLEETTFTNSAAERAEEGPYAEAALAYTERSVPVRTIGVKIPVTDEQLADVEGVQAIVEGRLRTMIQLRLDSQILNGDGTAPNLLGTLNVSGVQTQALGTDTRLDALLKAITKVRSVGKAEPSVVLLAPADWEEVRLSKTTDGVYLLGAPADGGPSRIWGVPVLTTAALAGGTAVVGDYTRHAALYIRRGIEVEVGTTGDDFGVGRRTIRAGMRCAVVHYRPQAFCLVTGL